MTKNIVRRSDNKIKGWKQTIQPVAIVPIAEKGPPYLKDMHSIVDDYGVGDTYFFSSNCLSFEQYVVFA